MFALRLRGAFSAQTCLKRQVCLHFVLERVTGTRDARLDHALPGVLLDSERCHGRRIDMLNRRFETLEVIERVRPLLKGLSGERIVVPGIVVVGAQSSGKSSVLEHATGLGFPRGEGMCTRVPTVVSVQGMNCSLELRKPGQTCTLLARGRHTPHLPHQLPLAPREPARR